MISEALQCQNLEMITNEKSHLWSSAKSSVTAKLHSSLCHQVLGKNKNQILG